MQFSPDGVPARIARRVTPENSLAQVLAPGAEITPPRPAFRRVQVAGHAIPLPRATELRRMQVGSVAVADLAAAFVARHSAAQARPQFVFPYEPDPDHRPDGVAWEVGGRVYLGTGRVLAPLLALPLSAAALAAAVVLTVAGAAVAAVALVAGGVGAAAGGVVFGLGGLLPGRSMSVDDGAGRGMAVAGNVVGYTGMGVVRIADRLTAATLANVVRGAAALTAGLAGLAAGGVLALCSKAVVAAGQLRSLAAQRRAIRAQSGAPRPDEAPPAEPARAERSTADHPEARERSLADAPASFPGEGAVPPPAALPRRSPEVTPVHRREIVARSRPEVAVEL